MPDFWRNSGFHLLERDAAGRLRVTDDFLRAYLLRPEIHPVEGSGPLERRLHASLMAEPRRSIPEEELKALEDDDVRDNYRILLRWRGRLYDTRWFSFVCAFSSPLPFLAILAGWTVTETGRQPYVVQGLLRTADAVSPVAPGAVFGTLGLFVVVYTVLLIAFFFYATRLVLRGPEVGAPEQHPASVRPGVGSHGWPNGWRPAAFHRRRAQRTTDDVIHRRTRVA